MRTPKRLVPLLLILILAASVASIAGCNSVGSAQNVYQKAAELARADIWKDINGGKASSGTVAITDGGAVVYSEGFGMADRENSVPVDTNTIFNIGSSSKTFDSAAVMRLVDDGKVKLDAPVIRYLPEFKMEDPRYKDITVRMLLDHSSGLPGTTTANNVGYAVNPSFYKDTLETLSHSHLKAAPGDFAPYCNDGFTLAEMLVARVKHYNNGRPYILAGHSQGSNILINLMAQYMKKNPDVYKRMITSYMPGYSITPQYLTQNKELKFATGPDDTGVIVSYNTAAPTTQVPDPVVLPGAMVINPITWTRDETLATAAQNLGGISVQSNGYPVLDAQGNPQKVLNFADAQVNTAKGELICSTADPATLDPGNSLVAAGIYHSFDYPFYYVLLLRHQGKCSQQDRSVSEEEIGRLSVGDNRDATF
jgi:hypothetical protein